MDIVLYGSGRVRGFGQICFRALTELGHDIYYFEREYPHPIVHRVSHVFNRARNVIKKTKRERLISFVEDKSPDLTLVIKGYDLDARTISAVRSGSRFGVVNWNPDNPFQARSENRLAETHLDSLSEYSLICTWGDFLIDRLRDYGASDVLHLPFAYDPNHHFPMEPAAEYRCDVIFVGHWSKKRECVLSHLDDFDVKIFGPGWENCKTDSVVEHVQGEGLEGVSYGKALSSAKIGLNVVGDHNAPAYNMRSFEIPATKTLMATTYTPGQEQFFEDGQDAVLYKDADDLQTNLDYYLSNHSNRERVAKNGYETVKPHTYQNRIKTMLDHLIEES